MSDIPIFYLNLERRKDRNENCIKEFKKAGFTNVTRIEALDANSYRPTPAELKYFDKFPLTSKTSLRIMCNMLGHMKMWKKIIDDNLDYAMICQDDVYFIDGIADYVKDIIQNIPENTEIINIGLHKYGCLSTFIPWDLKKEQSNNLFSRKINEYIGVIKKNTVNPCSLCYILTKQGAQKILEYTLKNGISENTDNHMNHYYYSRDMYYGSATVLATGDPSFGSDIFC
jgi:GR25 family glycosyltransferase involved in LPS biosynthesis